MSSERSPSMQFYFRQFAGDDNIQSMDLDAIGAHILLMCYAGSSKRRYAIAYDRIKLTRLLHLRDDAEFDRIFEQLLDGPWKLTKNGKVMEQDGMKRAFAKQRVYSKQQSQNAQKRWKKHNSLNDMRPHSDRNAKRMRPQCSSSSSSTSIKKEKEQKEKFEFTSDKFGKGFIDTWLAWVEYRQTLKKPKDWKKFFSAQFTKLHKFSEDNAIKILEASTLNGYAGLVWDRYPEGNKSATKNSTQRATTFPAKEETPYQINLRIDAVNDRIKDLKEDHSKYNRDTYTRSWTNLEADQECEALVRTLSELKSKLRGPISDKPKPPNINVQIGDMS